MIQKGTYYVNQMVKMNTKIRSNGNPYTIKNDKNRFFFPDEYMKVEDLLKKNSKHTIICLINTGARINEVKNIRMSDIDFINNRIVLRVTKTKAKKKETKGRVRTIPISSKFSRYLKKHFNNSKEDDYIKILSTPAFNIALKIATNKAKLKDSRDFSAHNIRKTLETWLLALGVDGLALTAHFGHDQRTAAINYVSPDIFSWEEKKKIREIIGDLYDR